MLGTRLIASVLLSCSAFVSHAAAQSCAGDPGFAITLTPSDVEIGGSFEECLVTPPGDWMVFFVPSFHLANTPTKYGPLCIGTPFIDIFAFPMPTGGELCLGQRMVPCDAAYIGAQLHFQFVAVAVGQPAVAGISNLATVTVVDGPCDDPCSGSLGDFVWVDLDGNDLQDPGEPGIPGVLLILKDGMGNVIDTTYTDGNGLYAFDGLCEGQYSIELDPASVPAGYVPVACDVGADDELDSDCSPVSVFLPTSDAVDLSIDFGFRGTPGMEIVKTADRTTIAPYEPVNYSYTVTNIGVTTLTDIVVTDDNGTPDHGADDFTIGTIASLAPGASAVLYAQVIPVVCTSAVVDGNTVNAGASIVVVHQLNGDVEVTYLQDFGINDNTYGAGAIGWPGDNHTFNHLKGSDKLELRFHDGDDHVVLDFYMDYISASSAFPSGYGSLGPSGGDGSLLVGSASSVVSWTTSLADNLNEPANLPFTSALIVDSPTSLVAGDVEVDPGQAPGGWDPINSYTVVVEAAAFGSAGFGSVSVPDQHNSPNKLSGPNGIATQPKDSTVVNTAKAVTATADGTLVATATAAVDIVVEPGTGGCGLLVESVKLDKKHLDVKIVNGGSAAAVLSALTLTWPAANGKLTQVKLGADVIYADPDVAAPSVSLTSGDFVSDLGKRTIAPGTTGTLRLDFEFNVDTDPAHYSGGLVTFGADCSLSFP